MQESVTREIYDVFYHFNTRVVERVTREIYDVFHHFNTRVVGIQPTGQAVTKTSLAKFGLKVSIEPGHA